MPSEDISKEGEKEKTKFFTSQFRCIVRPFLAEADTPREIPEPLIEEAEATAETEADVHQEAEATVDIREENGRKTQKGG